MSVGQRRLRDIYKLSCEILRPHEIASRPNSVTPERILRIAITLSPFRKTLPIPLLSILVFSLGITLIRLCNPSQNGTRLRPLNG
jgi:hypothetical protein